MKKILAICLLALVPISLSLPVLAGELNKPGENWERFSFNIGSFFTDRGTEFRLDSETLGVGTEIDFEDDLNLDDSDTVARIDAFYRLSRRNRLDLSYFDLSRDARRTININIQYGDQVFTAGTFIDSEFDLTITKAAYTYSFFKNAKLEAGVTAGLFVQEFDIVLTSPVATERADATAPLPVLGLRFTYALTPKWKLKASAEYFAIEADNYDGRLLDSQAAVEYDAWKNIGFGLGYNDVTMRIEAEDDDVLGRIEWKYRGFQLYTKAYF